MKEYLERLVEARNRAWNDAQSIIAAADAEKREMSAEERQSWDRVNADIDAKDAEIRSLVERADADKAADEARSRVSHLISGRPATEDAPAGPDFRALFRTGGATEVTLNDAEARSLFEKRDITAGAGSAGKTVPSATMVGRLYEELVRVSPIFGVSTILTTASGEPLDFPVVKAASDSVNAKIAATSAVAEGGAISEVDPVFDKVTITPAKYAALMQVSSELTQDTVVDLEGYLARAAAVGIRNKAAGALHTTLAAGATGVANAANIAGISYDNLVDVAYGVNPEYRANASWMFANGTLAAIRKLKDSNGLPLWQPSTAAGQPDTLLGFRVVESLNMPTTGASAKVGLFGDLSAHTIRQVAGVRFEVSTDFAFANDLVSYRVIWRGGSAVLDTQAIKALTVTA